MKTGMDESGSQSVALQALQHSCTSAYPLAKFFRDLTKETPNYLGGPGSRHFIKDCVASYVLNGRDVLFVLDELSVADIQLHDFDHTGQLTSYPKDSKRQAWLDHAFTTRFHFHQNAGLAGLYLDAASSEAAQLIDRQLSLGDLEFTTQGYLDYCDQVRLTQKLYQKIGHLPPAFQELNAGIFRHQSLEEGQEFIQTKLEEFLTETEKLQYDYTRDNNAFLRQRRTELSRQGLVLTVLLSEYRQAINAPFAAKAASRKERRRYEKERQEEIDRTLAALQATHNEKPPFDFDWTQYLAAATNKGNPDLSIADAYVKALNVWVDNQRKLLREEQIGLSAATNPSSSLEWESHGRRLAELIERINNSGLFQRPIGGSANTVTRQQKVLEQLLEKLRSLQRLLPELPGFFTWQHHWFSLPAEIRRLLGPLLLLPATDWVAAFSAWYFENGLADRVFEQAFFPFSESGLKENYDEGIKKESGRITIVTSNEIPAQEFDLVVQFTASHDALLTSIPTLLLREPSSYAHTESKPVHYLSRPGIQVPGIAFCQEFNSIHLPKWTAKPSPKSLKELLALGNQFFGQGNDDEVKKVEGSRWSMLVQQSSDLPVKWMNRLPFWEDKFEKIQLHLSGFSVAKDSFFADLLPRLWASAVTLEIVVDAGPDEITNALLSDGFSGSFALAASLRAIESIEGIDEIGWNAMAVEVRKRLGAPKTNPSPLIKELLPLLRQLLPKAHLRAHVGWRDLILPLIIQLPSGKKYVLLPDDIVPGADTVTLETARRRELEMAGFQLIGLLSSDMLANVEAALEEVKNKLSYR